MIKNPVRDWFLIQRVEELPSLSGDCLYLDFETTSRDPDKDSINPWHTCWGAGIAIKSDAHPSCFYIPFGHHETYETWNLPRESVIRWLRVILPRFKSWANANVKYDVHVLFNDLGVDVLDGKARLELADITTLAKLVETDREYKGGYGLDKLVEWLLGESITKYEEMLQRYLGKANKDYGRIPPDVMYSYACSDVEYAEKCYKALLRLLPADTAPLWETEKRVTRILSKIERRGLRVDLEAVLRKSVDNITRMMQLEEKIFAITGRWVNVTSPTDMYDYVCNQLGLPVLYWTNEDDDERKSNPSFSKDALADYLLCADAPKEFFEVALELRERRTFQSIFLDPYSVQNVGGVIHPTINQCVRTGRTSCSEPNLQQLNKFAKELIVPRKGNTLIRWDYCNIEYRYIAHYIQAVPIIEEFQRNPDADYHDIVAKFCGIDRQPAKTVNFLTAYGGGLDRLIKALSALTSVVSHSMELAKQDSRYAHSTEEQQRGILSQKVTAHAKGIFREYHARMPTLKPTSKRAENLCKQRGFIQNLYGRRRHLPVDLAYRAFNALCQGAAADLMKVKMVQMEEALNGLGIDSPCPPVHDEYLLEGPSEVIEDSRFIRDATCIMEDTTTLVEGRSIDISIPVRTDYGMSRINWNEASRKENKQKMPFEQRKLGEKFNWLR